MDSAWCHENYRLSPRSRPPYGVSGRDARAPTTWIRISASQWFHLFRAPRLPPQDSPSQSHAGANCPPFSRFQFYKSPPHDPKSSPHGNKTPPHGPKSPPHANKTPPHCPKLPPHGPKSLPHEIKLGPHDHKPVLQPHKSPPHPTRALPHENNLPPHPPTGARAARPPVPMPLPAIFIQTKNRNEPQSHDEPRAMPSSEIQQ